MSEGGPVFNPPPGWPKPPEGWTPPRGWTPDPAWPEPPPGWRLWLDPGSPEAGAGDARPSQAERPPAAEVTGGAGGASATLERRVAVLRAENAALREQLERLGDADGAVVLDDDAVLQEVGIYRYHHRLEDAVAYKERLRDLEARVADVVKAGEAIEMSNMFTFDNSLAKGRRMTRDLAKLMLRAYNAEADNSVRALRAGNVSTAKRRLERSRETIAKLGGMMEMRISDAFHGLRLEEIELTADYLMKKQEEREAAREERARLREQRKVEQELAAERERLDKERGHLVNNIERLAESGVTDEGLAKRLAEIDEAIAQNDYRVANIRAGYVYVISNRGAFGPGVVKIGLTRRLEPRERIGELGGASVPFRFDTHALFFSEDAVTLEAELHAAFAHRRVNCINARKEFFFATPLEVQEVLVAKVGNLLEFREQVESTEYLQSKKYWPERAAERT